MLYELASSYTYFECNYMVYLEIVSTLQLLVSLCEAFLLLVIIVGMNDNYKPPPMNDAARRMYS